MADRVRFGVSATPIETIAAENTPTGDTDIIASEIGKTLGGRGDSLALAAYNNSAANQGYLNATVNYSTASHSAGGTKLTAIEPDFVFIKNTGYKFSSATVLGAATTDVVIVAIKVSAQETATEGGWVTGADTPEIHFLEIAWLQPGQAIVLPLGCNSKSVTQFGSNENDLSNLGSDSQYGRAEIYVKTVVAAGTAASSGNAVEYLAVT